MSLVACGGGGEMVDVPDGGGPLPGEGLAGALRSEAGQPLASTQILACMATTCLFGMTQSDGRFTFAVDPPASIALKTLENLSASPRRGAALCPIHLDGDTLEVGELYVPDLPAGAAIGPSTRDPQTLDAGDGLQVTLRRGDLMPNLGDVITDLAARRVPSDRVCRFLTIPGEEVVAVYALHPFAARSRSPMAVRLESSLPAGTSVSLRTVSEIDGHLSQPVAATADGGAIVTDPGAGIGELTWLIVSR